MRKAINAAKSAYLYLTGKGTFMVLALFFAILVSSLTVISIYARSAQAATNSTINFQARVLTSGGAVVADGNYSVEFKVYDDAGAGINEWTETQNLAAKNGYITASLGSVTPFPGSIDWSQEHWLTLNINGDGEMGPTRMKVTGVPYSFRSGQADSLTNGAGMISASQLAQLAPGTVQGVSSANTALRINQTGAGSLLQLQSAGVDKLTVSNTGDTSVGGSLAVANGITVGNSTSTTAGTIRWTGTVFEGYNGAAWTSLGGTALGNPIINKVKLVTEIQNNTVNATATLQNDDELFFAIGANETWTFRFMVQGNANATPDFKFAVTAPGGAICNVSTADHEAAVSVANLGCGVSTGLVTGNTTNDLYEIVGTIRNGGTAGTVQLQWAQNTANAANSIVLAGSSVLATRAVGANGTSQAFIQNGNSFGASAFLGTNDNNDLNFITNGNTRLSVLANGNVGIGDNTPAALFTVGTNDALQVTAAGDLSTKGSLQVDGQAKLNSNLIAGGIASGVSETTAAPASTNVTVITLTAPAFANNDVIFINNAGQDYYTRIVSGGGTANLVVSPAVSYDAGATVERYTVQNIGATSTDYTSQSNRFFQGYFLGGVVVGAGSTTLSDGSLSSTTDLNIQTNGGLVKFGGDVNITGTVTGNGAGLTNIDGSQISGGSITDGSLSANVTLLGNTFNGASQLLQLDATGALPALNGSALTNVNGSNISSGTIDNARLNSNVTLLGNTFNGASQLVQLDVTGTLPALDGGLLTLLNGSSISSGTLADARLSGNVTLGGNSFNLANSLVQLDGTGALPALSGAALTNLNASYISSGTLDNARLNSSVTLLGNTFNGVSQLIQLDGTGAIPALNGSALTSLNASNLSAGTVNDARLSTNVTLKGNTFNGNNGLVLLDGTGLLPSLNGSALSSLNGSNISSGTVNDLRLSANVTLKGNTFNGNSQLVLLDATGALPALNAGALTSLNATNLATGTVDNNRLSTGVTLLGNSFNGSNQLLQLDVVGALPALNAGALTSLNATNISGGTLADGRLSTNVGLRNLAQSFTALQTFEANIVLGKDTATAQSGLITFNDATIGNGFTSVLGTNTLTANRAIDLPNEDGTLCIRNSAACGFIMLASGTAQVDSTTNASIFINKTGASGNIMTLQKNGSTTFSVLNSGALQLQLTDASAFTVNNAGGTQFFDVDTSAGLVQIGGSAADVNATLLVLDTKNTAGDPTGVDGASYYNSILGAMRCYENGQWKNCVDETNVVKTADQTVTNNAAFQNGTNQTFSMAANSSYAIDASINYTGTSAAADFKYTFTAPAGAAVYLNTDAATSVNSNTVCNIAASGQTCTVLIAANFRGTIRVTGYVRTGATAGNLQFQFAQNNGTAGQSVTVYQGSMLAYRKTQ